jgi:glycosyltransferase involved in cell wall biosynthesis
MRIGITTSVGARGQSGIGRYICSLTKAFLEHADEHSFTLFVLEEDAPLFAFAEKGMRIVKVPERFRAPAADIFWHQAGLPVIAKSLGLDVVHVPSYRRMIWSQPCAMVATIHDLAPFHVHGKYDFMRMLYGRYWARVMAGRQDRIVAISQSTARDARRFFKVSPERLSVIYNGLDHGLFRPGTANTLVPFFLYVARLEHPGKNHILLLHAFERFKAETKSNWQLVLAGKDWPGAEVIHGAIRTSPFSKEIRCLGFVPEEDLPGLYRSAGALVSPSLFEGFGLPLAEAMACGCAVLCSTGGSQAEVVDGAALMAEAGDANGWAQGLRRLATDDKLRIQLREAGLVRAQVFDWRKAASGTLEVYRGAVEKKSSQSRV